MPDAHFRLDAGVGLGLLLGAALVELELMTLQRNAWASRTGIVLVGVGQLIAWRASRRGPPRETERPQGV